MSHRDPFTPTPGKDPARGNRRRNAQNTSGLPSPAARQNNKGLPLPPRRKKRRRPKRHDEPNSEAMKNRPVAAAGEVTAKESVSDDRLPEDSLGGVHPPPPPPPAPHIKKSALDHTTRIQVPRYESFNTSSLGKVSNSSSDRLKKLFPWILAFGVVVIVAVITVGIIFQKKTSQKRREKEVKSKIRSVKLKYKLRKKNQRLPPGKCAHNMVWVSQETESKGFCIDIYEFPSTKGVLPTNVSDIVEAKKLCKSVGKRVCTKKEWQRACSGSKDLLYPYGNEYHPAKCVTKPREEEAPAVQPSGFWGECRTASGIYDMSGNKAEWVLGGTLMGGSGAMNEKEVSCKSEGGGGGPAYYGTRCCTSPAATSPANSK